MKCVRDMIITYKQICYSSSIQQPRGFAFSIWSNKLFAKNFPKNSNLNDLGIFLPAFLSRTNPKLHNIYITPKMVKKIIMNKGIWSWLYSSDGSKELWAWSFIHTYLNSSICVWKSPVFQIVERFHCWSLCLRMLGKRILLKTAALLVFFLSLIKSLKDLWIIGLLIT